MTDSYVCSGATMKCTMGDQSAKLTVLPSRTVYLCGKPMANISDHTSMANLAPFGKCRSLAYPATASATAAALGTLTPMPCVHNTPLNWMGGKTDYLVQGHPALLKSCKCQCIWGGTIRITEDGQSANTPPDLNKQKKKVFRKRKTSKDLAITNVEKRYPLALRNEGTIWPVPPQETTEGTVIFDPRNASRKQKGNYAEIRADQYLVKDFSNNSNVKNPLTGKQFNLKRIGNPPPQGLDDKIRKGIDGIYTNTPPPPAYIIVEVKYGKAHLRTHRNRRAKKKADKTYKQGSNDWIVANQNKRLMTTVGFREAKIIRKEIRTKNVERVLAVVDKNGNVKTVRLDKKGNKSGLWP